MPYIPFTEEQKRRANSVDLAEYLRRRGEKLIPSGPEYRLASDHSVAVRGREWYDHEAKEGGGPVSFLQTFHNLSYPEAVQRLLDGEGVPCPSAVERKPEAKPFALPPSSDSMRRVFAYLLKERHISREVLTAFVRADLIYRDVMDAIPGVTFYFPPPYAPWQRGTNENTNGLLREFIPKGSDIAALSHEQIQLFEDALNLRPRKCLGWLSPFEVHFQKVLHLT